jgi:hypothetical protein
MLNDIFGARAVPEASEFVHLKNTGDQKVGLTTGNF